jgi:hypothetical protein
MAPVIGQYDALELDDQAVAQMFEKGWSEDEVLKLKAESYRYFLGVTRCSANLEQRRHQGPRRGRRGTPDAGRPTTLSDFGAAIVARWSWLLPFACLNGALAAAPVKNALTALGKVGDRIDTAAAGPLLRASLRRRTSEPERATRIGGKLRFSHVVDQTLRCDQGVRHECIDQVLVPVDVDGQPAISKHRLLDKHQHTLDIASSDEVADGLPGAWLARFVSQQIGAF